MPAWLLATVLVIGVGTIVVCIGAAVGAYRRRKPLPPVSMTLWRGSELLGQLRESPRTGPDADSRGGARSQFTGYLIPRAEVDIHGVIQSRPYNDSRSCTQIPAEPIIAARAGENHPRPATGPNVDLQPLSAEGTTPLEAQLVLRGEDGVEIPAYGIILLELRYEPGAFARMKHSLGDGGDPIPDDAYINGRVWRVSVGFDSPFDLAFRD